MGTRAAVPGGWRAHRLSAGWPNVFSLPPFTFLIFVGNVSGVQLDVAMPRGCPLVPSAASQGPLRLGDPPTHSSPDLWWTGEPSRTSPALRWRMVLTPAFGPPNPQDCGHQPSNPMASQPHEALGPLPHWPHDPHSLAPSPSCSPSQRCQSWHPQGWNTSGAWSSRSTALPPPPPPSPASPGSWCRPGPRRGSPQLLQPQGEMNQPQVTPGRTPKARRGEGDQESWRRGW